MSEKLTEATEKKKSEKARRTGQIISRVQDKWLVRIFTGRDPVTGKRRYHSETIKGKKKAATDYLANALHRLQLGEPLKPTEIAFGDFLDHWLDAKKLTVREISYRQYANVVRIYLRPALGNERLIDHDRLIGAIQKMYGSLQARGISSTTIRYIHALLTSIFDLAMRRELIRRSPMLKVDQPRAERREPSVLDAEQMKTFLRMAESRRESFIFVLAFYTGSRPEEYLGWKWSDVDWTAGTITTQRAIHWRKTGDWYLSETKSAKSNRTIPLTKPLIDRLTLHRTRQLEERMKAGKEWRKHDFIFADEIGEPIAIWRIRTAFNCIIKAAGLPSRVRLYDSRHSCATALMSSGVNPKVVSERLGHSDIDITLHL
jgi:integrase